LALLLIAGLALLTAQEILMADDTSDAYPDKVSFTHPPAEEERRAWLLSLAGDDPARRRAVLHWLTIEGVDLFDRHEDRIVEVHCENAVLRPDDIRDIALFPELDDLTVINTPLTPEMLAIIRGQKTLKRLEISGDSEIDNEICDVAAGLPALLALTIRDAAIDDRGVQFLARHPTLRGLTLTGCKLSSGSMRDISQLPKITHLKISANPLIADEGLQHLTNLPNLIWLDLSGTSVTDSGVMHLRGMNLGVLELGGTSVTDRSAEIISGMDRMTQVGLQGTKITNETVRLLAPLPKLGGGLDLRDTAIDNGCVTYFQQILHRPRIDLRGTKITKQGMEQIRALLKLDVPLIHDHGVPVIDHSRPEVQRETR
jgi:hypothetical protein